MSTCITVKNLNPNSTDDDVAHYFESAKAGGSTVLKVQACEKETKYVFFEDFAGKQNYFYCSSIKPVTTGGRVDND